MAVKRELAEKNRLFRLVHEQDKGRLERDLVPTTLPLGRELYPSSQPMDAVYFPVDCVVSVLKGTDEDGSVEMATIGNEGLAGAFSLLYSGRAIGKNIVQVAGDALRLEMSSFVRYVDESKEFYKLIHRYLFALTHQIIQAGACNQLHTTEERCARWLLMTHDRAGSDTLALTQEFLAGMLGIRRATVNLAVGILKNAGLIKYVRGYVTVMDREGLESSACSCYELIRREYLELGTVG